MLHRIVVPILLLATVVACSDHPTPSPTAASSPAPAPLPARERLAARLAVALADPALRADLAAKFAASHAPEGKLQFQALARTGDRQLLARLAAAGDGRMTTLLADLDAARGLEIYLPVAAQRAAWQGGEAFLVGTLEHDGERPVAFDAAGRRILLDADHPPEIPVIALVPQEFDFTGGNPAHAMLCWDFCGEGGGSDGGGLVPSPSGLFLVATHFEEDHEGWLKGNPEYEFHVYGESGGESEQLGCTGERSRGPYYWDTDNRDWQGSAALLTKADIDAYRARSPKGVVRIVAWEDDDTPCVPVTNGNTFTDMVKQLDVLYRQWTGAKLKSSVGKGLEAAVAAYGLAKSVRNFILTSDDVIGHAVETSVAGWAPGNANFLLKGAGARTTGWFETVYRQ
ncbi:MAG: hypothetical protein ABI542_06405 [Gemmatimonadota bacterium]